MVEYNIMNKNVLKNYYYVTMVKNVLIVNFCVEN